MPVVFLSDADFGASGETALGSRDKALSEWNKRRVTELALAEMRRENTPALRYFMMARQLALMHAIKHQAETFAEVFIESPPAYARGPKGVVLGATPEFPLYLGGDDKGADEALTASLSVLIARHLATFKTRRSVFTDTLVGNLARAAQSWIRFPVDIFQQGSTLDDELDAAVNSAMQAAQKEKERQDEAKAREFRERDEARSNRIRAMQPLPSWEERQAQRARAERMERVEEQAVQGGGVVVASWIVPTLEFGYELFMALATS